MTISNTPSPERDKSLRINYFSDILCVWAWIAERRNQELASHWGPRLRFEEHFLDLFCDTKTRLEQGWAQRGGYLGFARHVVEAAAPYEEASIHPDCWAKVRPKTSANAHLVIKAAQILSEQKSDATRVSSALRCAFFVDAADIGQLPLALDIAVDAGFDRSALRELIENGSAIAGLLADTKLASAKSIQGSPSWLLNDGRQLLYGNLVYRVLNANISELLEKPANEASWC